jgi:hypothetical protein
MWISLGPDTKTPETDLSGVIKKLLFNVIPIFSGSKK